MSMARSTNGLTELRHKEEIDGEKNPAECPHPRCEVTPHIGKHIRDEVQEDIDEAGVFHKRVNHGSQLPGGIVIPVDADICVGK